MKVVLAVGGTGGHLHPAVALSKEFSETNDVLFVGGGLSDNPFIKKGEIHFVSITSSPLSGVLSPLKILKGVIESLKALKKTDVVVGFGSYHSLPVLLAALIKRVPVFLYESNIFPGKVIRLLSRFAVCTGVQFEKAKKKIVGKSECIQTPMKFAKKVSRDEALAYYGLDPLKKVVLVFGGSQGSLFINRAVSALKQTVIANKGAVVDFQIVHITGKERAGVLKETIAKNKTENETENEAESKTEYEKGSECDSSIQDIKVVQKSYEDKMHMAWSASDVVIARSGALSIAEMIHFEIPSILIPYPYAADDHQKKNALYIQDVVKGGYMFLESFAESSKKGPTEVSKEDCRGNSVENSSNDSLKGSSENSLDQMLQKLLAHSETLKSNIQAYKKQKREKLLADLIHTHMEKKAQKGQNSKRKSSL